MDNEIKKNDANNTSTQKTVRLKPLVKQPVVGDNSTESQSVKKVSTNSGVFPKVGTQTGRISNIATNTSRVVKINSSLRSTINSNAAGPSTTMVDFRTSELQMASSNQNTPSTTRPAPAAAPKSVLNSLNLKPKVAEASVVESPAAAPTVAAITPEAKEETQTAAIPKAPTPVKPTIKIATAPAVTPAATAATAPAITPAASAAAAQNDAPTVAAIIPEAKEDTQTAAVPKAAVPGSKPVINIKTNTNVAAGNTESTDDSTVKLKRPERPGATKTNSVVPTITAKPAAAPAAAPAASAPTVVAAPTVSAAPSPVKPSAAPTVKLNLNKGVGEGAETAAPQPAAEPAKPKLGLKKAEAPQPAEAPKEEAPKEEAEKEPAADAKEPKKEKKSKKAAAAAAPGKGKKAAVVVSQDMPPAFHFSVGFLAAIFILAAATFCAVQYVNTYQPRLFGKYIQIPFMEQVGK